MVYGCSLLFMCLWFVWTFNVFKDLYDCDKRRATATSDCEFSLYANCRNVRGHKQTMEKPLNDHVNTMDKACKSCKTLGKLLENHERHWKLRNNHGHHIKPLSTWNIMGFPRVLGPWGPGGPPLRFHMFFLISL